MKTIATHTVLLVQIVRDSVHISLSRHGLVEGGVEHTYLRQTWHQLLNSINTLQVSGVVQGSQIRALLESLQNLVGKNHALIEFLAAVHHTVTYSVDLLQIFDHTDFGIGKQREDKLNTLGMLGDIVHNLLLLAIGQLYLYKGIVQAYTLGTTTGHHTLIVHVVQGVLDR